DGGGRPGRSPFDTSVGQAARVYDYWLGGTDHFAADRRAAETVMAVNPGVVPAVRSNRAFMARVVRYLAGPVGIRQFLDLGTGLPAVNNRPRAAQATAGDWRGGSVDHAPLWFCAAAAPSTRGA